MFKKNIEESKGAISHIWNEEKWRLPPLFYKMQKREKAGERKVRSADIGSEKERKEWKKSYLYEEMIYRLVCS